MMKISLSQLVLPKVTVPELLQLAKDNDYDEVELNLRHDANVDFNYDISDAQLKAFRDKAEELAVPITSMAIQAKAGNLLADGKEQEAGIESAVFGMECAAKLGAKVCLHTLGRLTPELYYEDAYNNAICALKKLAVTAEKLDVYFAVEFIWNGFLFSPLEMRNFIDAVGSKRVGFYFDPGNMAVFQFPQHWVRALGERIFHVHLKDWQGGALNGSWTALLEGEVDFPVVMKELRAASYNGPLVSEVAENLASIADTAVAMRKIAKM